MNSRPKTTKPHPGAKRRRAIYLPLLLALPVLGGLLWFCSRIETEPMTSDEMLAKEHWTAEQLAAAMTRVFSPHSNRDRREEVIEHLRRQLAQYSPEEQRRIRVQALKGSLQNQLSQFRALPPERRQETIAKLERDAEHSLQDAYQKNAELLNSPEGQAVQEEATRIMLAELSPAERRDLSKVIQTWVRLLQYRR